MFKTEYKAHTLNIFSVEKKRESWFTAKKWVIDLFPCNPSQAVTQSRDPDHGGDAGIVRSTSLGNDAFEASHIKLC